MTRVLVLYNQPADKAAFDRYYFETHVPLAKSLPGLRSYIVNAGAPAVLGGDLTPYLVAELEFDSPEAVQQALASAEGQATVGDLPNFAQTGVNILTFDTRKV